MKILNFYLLLVFVLLCNSCTTKIVNNETQKQLPEGKWNVLRLQSNDSIILFDNQKNYTITFLNQNKLIVTAEDNVMRCEISKLAGARAIIKMVSKTDVCCNSTSAEALFDFIVTPLQITQLKNELLLSSEKGVLELVK